MTDQELVSDSLHKAHLVISAYVEPGLRNPQTTLDALILILDDQELARAPNGWVLDSAPLIGTIIRRESHWQSRVLRNDLH
jgi:hypothetical protein